LVIVNPKSGPGNSEAYWKNGIQILLKYTKLFDYKVVITQKQYHGTEICEQLNPSTYDYIVVLGGDGTASEVYNGLNQNNNKNALNIPVLCLPTGSGNAMATELKAENTKNFLLDAIRNIIYGYSVYIDAYAAKQKNQTDTLGFISTQWGVMAVIDFESEKFRFMGNFRFEFKGVLELISGRFYNARLYFKPCNINDIKSDKIHKVMDNENRDNNDNINESKDDNEWWMDLKNKKISEINIPNGWCYLDEQQFGLLCATNLRYITETSCFGGKDFQCM